MERPSQKRPIATLLMLLVTANVFLAGLHTIPSAFASFAAFSGHEVVICSDGVLERIIVGRDGQPLDRNDGRQLAGDCQVCAAYNGQNGILASTGCCGIQSHFDLSRPDTPPDLLRGGAGHGNPGIRAPPAIA